MFGGTIHVPTLFGKGNLKIAEGTQTGTVFRLRGQGMPHLRGNGQGDLLVRVQIEVPKKLTKEQERSLRPFLKPVEILEILFQNPLLRRQRISLNNTAYVF